MFKQKKKTSYQNPTRFILLCACIGVALSGQSVQAASEEVLELETFEVTGSRIPRTDMEGIAPLVQYDRVDIERSGATTINEFLRNNVYNSAGIIDESFTQGFAPGTSGIDLRGLGAHRTLVLLDGRRLPVYPFAQEIEGQEGSHSFVDVNSIPLAAIERIEVLKDGASAIYGADAVAGVVNFITRKDMDGVEATVQGGTSIDEGDGTEGRLSMVTGKQWEKTSATLIVDYLNRDDIMAKDRDFSESANGPFDARSIHSSPGNIFAAPFPVAPSNCPPDRLVSFGGPASGCLYDYAPLVTLVPETERIGLLGNLEHELGNGLRLFASAMYNYSYSESQLAPAPTAFPDRLFFVGADNVNNPLGEDMNVTYRLEELGPRRDEFETNAYNLVGGIGGYVGAWDWEAALGYGRVDTDSKGVNGYASFDDLQTAVTNETLNLFGPSLGFDAESVMHTVRREGESKHYYADVKATGEVYELSAGSVQMAVGAEIRREEYYDRFDGITESGVLLGIGGTSGEGDRDLQSAYAELSIPATEDLELQLAGRFDHYDDFGNTFNPKIGLRWQPRSDLLIRASAGTGFKAPSLNELYSGLTRGTDTVLENGQPVEVTVTKTGNPDLDPEESKSVNLGFVWDITGQWDLGIDGWYIKNDDAVSNDPQYILDNEAEFPDLVEREDGNLVAITSPFENMAAQKLWGIDIDTHVDWAIERAGDFRFGVVASYLGAYKQEAVEGDGYENLAGEDGRPEWRAQSTLLWNKAEFGGSVTVNFVGGYERPDVDDPDYDYIESWTTVDTQFNWSPRAITGGTITLGIDNLFDKEPSEDPFFERWPFVNRALHNPRGRFGYLRYKHEF